MRSKNYVGVIVGISAIVVIRGIQTTQQVGDAVREQRAANELQAMMPAEVELLCASNHGEQEVQAIQKGMTFAQLKDVFRIIRFDKPEVDEFVKAPYVLIKFLNPDKSSIEVVLRNGKVTGKKLYSAQQNRQREQKRKHQEYLDNLNKH